MHTKLMELCEAFVREQSKGEDWEEAAIIEDIAKLYKLMVNFNDEHFRKLKRKLERRSHDQNQCGPRRRAHR